MARFPQTAGGSRITRTNRAGPRSTFGRSSRPAQRARLWEVSGQVSTAGGIMPVWCADGKELYYLNPDVAMMAALITVNGSSLDAGAPVLLFPTDILGGGTDFQLGRQYDVSPVAVSSSTRR